MKPLLRTQRGATLVVALIMIVLVTLIVVSGYTLSSSNLKSVGNMQMREETVAAANQAVEAVLSSPFTNAPATEERVVDINKDGTDDFTVNIAVPVCIRATQSAVAAPSDVELPVSMSSGSTWNTDWEVQATVTDAASGAAVTVRQGVRVLLTESQKTTVCP